MDPADIHKPEEEEKLSAHYDVRLPKLPWHRRVQIPIIAAIVYSVIRTLGPTLRYEVIGRRHADEQWAAKQPYDLGFLAPGDHSHCVVWQESRDCHHEYYRV